MSQDWEPDPFSGSHVATVDLQTMEDNFNAFKSSFSGSSAPSFTEAFTIWMDTVKDLLKVRDSADSSWLGILCGDINSKLWLYRNDTCEGWVIDTAITDRVVALKGGANAYNVDGGNLAGTWTWPGHQLATSEIPSHTHTCSSATGDHSHSTVGCIGGSTNPNGGSSGSTHSHSVSSVGSNVEHRHGSDTARIYAAVGTLQYPDLP